MFIKGITKENKTTGERKMRFRLCQSYRSGNAVKHHTIIDLGELPELPYQEQRRKLGLLINSLITNEKKPLLFDTQSDKVIETLAHDFYKKIRESERLDIKANAPQLVDIDSMKHSNVREIGSEWLVHQALEQLKLKDVLLQEGFTDEEANLAYTHIISRAVFPASEYRTTSWIKENSAVCEVTNYPNAKITKDKLYAISHKLYASKNELEKHLSNKTNELFDLQDSIILYDLTNTYYEGSMKQSSIAKYGRSKEKRTDAKLIVLALVINVEGFLKYSNIFEGNTTDSKTLETILQGMTKNAVVGTQKPVVVMDAGIATDANLAMLKAQGYDYMCVTRNKLKHYNIDTASKSVIVTDNKKQTIELQKIIVEGSDDTFLQVKSKAKELKEQSMNSLFTQRFEDGLKQINDALQKKSGIKKVEKVHERIGRLKQKYTTTHKYYNITVATDKKGKATSVTWQQKEIEHNHGTYFLRTTLNHKQEENQWKIYNAIREIEYTFRTLKTDIDLRPIYHKTDEASMAHLHLGLLAYWAVNTIRYQLKQKEINTQWKDVVRTMNTQKSVTTSIKNNLTTTIQIRQCSEPNTKVTTIYDALKFKHKPYHRKKFVVPPA